MTAIAPAPHLFRLDGRGMLPWLLVLLYAAIPFGLLLGYGDWPPPEHYVTTLAIMAAIVAVLSALGPFFLIFYALLFLSVLAGQTPYTGDCRSLGDEFLLYVPMTIALPGACLVTSVLMYRLGREALAPDSRRLGNVTFPLIGLIVGYATLAIAQGTIARALETSRVCSGG